MAICKLKKGDRIYECRYHEATLIELITDPELLVQGGDSHYWHWKAKIIETNSRNVVPGEIVEYGITEEAPAYGPKLFRKNMYEVGYANAEPILPPFDTGMEKQKKKMFRSMLDFLRNKDSEQEPVDEKVIDLSDNTQYPASVLADLNYVFSLGDDSENMISFIKGSWQKPVFHWGWDDITHEDAVNSDFLGRAFYTLNTHHRKRRDAMIASEGYKFVWKNKAVEPIPGYLSGEELCKYLTQARESGLSSMKSINASEDRDARRWRLNPTYDDLMAEMKKTDEEADFYCRKMGCGMLRFTSKAYNNKQSFIVNTALGKAYAISESDGSLVGFTKDDIDWDNVSQLEHNDNAYRLKACYYFGIEDYKEGVARVNWMLYPDGRYFADEDGFGMEDNEEVNVYAYIDTECRVLVKFQDMEDPDKTKVLYQEAVRKASR